MTSLDASGFSITLLKVSPDALAALDTATSAVGWGQAFANFQKYDGTRVEESQPKETNGTVPSSGPKGWSRCIAMLDHRLTTSSRCGKLHQSRHSSLQSYPRRRTQDYRS